MENQFEYRLQYYDGVEVSEEASRVAVVAEQTTTGIDAELHARYGEISGTITGSSQVPIAEAQACALNVTTHQILECGHADQSGDYAIKHLRPAEYLVEFLGLPKGKYRPGYYKETTTIAQASAITVIAGGDASGVDDVLTEAEGAISGIVTDQSSRQTISGVEVCAYEAEGEGLFGECTFTGPSGGYVLEEVRAGRYVVEFSSPVGGLLNYVSQYYRGASRLELAQLVFVSKGNVSSNVDATLAKGGRITGKVVSASDESPISGALVCALATSGEIDRCVLSASNGEYAIPGVASGEQEVGFNAATLGYATQYYDEQTLLSAAQRVTVSVGDTLSGINARLSAGGRIAGRVTIASTGTALAGVAVCALTEAGDIVECAISNDYGEYTIEGLPPGEYAVEFSGGHDYTSQYYEDQPTLTAARLLSVTGGGLDGSIDAAMMPLGARREGGPAPGLPLAPSGAPPGSGSAIGEGAASPSGTSSGSSTAAPSGSTAHLSSAQLVALVSAQLRRIEKTAKLSVLRRGELTADFTAPEAGAVVIDWYESVTAASSRKEVRPSSVLVASARLSIAGPENVVIRLKTTRSGERLLRRSGGTRLTSKCSFTPVDESAVVLRGVFELRH